MPIPKPFFKNKRFLLRGDFLQLDLKFKENATAKEVQEELKKHGIKIKTFKCKICKQERLWIDRSIYKGVCIGCMEQAGLRG